MSTTTIPTVPPTAWSHDPTETERELRKAMEALDERREYLLGEVDRRYRAGHYGGTDISGAARARAVHDRVRRRYRARGIRVAREIARRGIEADRSRGDVAFARGVLEEMDDLR